MKNKITVAALTDPSKQSVSVGFVDPDGKDVELVLSRIEIEEFKRAISSAADQLGGLLGDESTWRLVDCAGCAKGPIPHDGPCLNSRRMQDKNRRVAEAAAEKEKTMQTPPAIQTSLGKL